jgi:hypothetical protein
MDLVCTVQIAVNLCSISKKEIEQYEHYMLCYMTIFKLLYKLVKVKPIHHTALHYGDILQGFGLAHTVLQFMSNIFMPCRARITT